MSDLKAVILDIDGTLLFSNEAHALAFTEAAASLGISSDYLKLRQLIGKGRDKLIPEAFGVDADSRLGTQLDEMKGDIFRVHYLPFLEPTPGARALLTKLGSEDIQRVVATSGRKADAAQLLKRAGVLDLVNDTTTADDARASKPAPDILQAALTKLGVGSDSVFMLGDTPYDVEASHRANIRCIALRCGGWADSDLRGAVAILDDPADLLAHYDQTLHSQ